MAVSLRRVNNRITVTGPGINVTIAAVDESGQVIPLNDDGSIQITDSRSLFISLQEGLSDSESEFWIFSIPTLITTARFSASGTLDQTLVIPDKIPAGDHRLVVKMKALDGSDKVVSLGVRIGSTDEGVPVSRIIFGILSAAIAVGLVIPATRYRRRRFVAG